MKRNLIFSLVALIFLGTMLSTMGEKESKKLAGTDKYKVIRVDGRIIFQRTDSEMKKGDIFLSGTALSFKTPQARAAVISSIKGRFVISPSEKGQTKILPAANNISSRSGALINMIDLQNHFSGDYLVLDEIQLEIGEENFPMDGENFFYMSFTYKGEKIRKKLKSNEGNLLLIEKEDLYKIDGESIPVETMNMSLYYRQGDKSTKISEFKPVFPDLIELKEEIQIIREEFADKESDTQIQEITAYLGEFYGKPQKENLNGWLKQEFGLE
ncbi:MAG: hypothetical protein ACI8ZM_001941 [Crocinitomix sp.]|jgi:hypothetical protein